MKTGLELTKYDIRRSYDWNYEHAPEAVDTTVPPISGNWTFLGLKVASPLGIPAGPLLNGQWCLYYGSLGFDVLTYKTVRSGYRECYDLPNLQPVKCGSLNGDEAVLPASENIEPSWAVSFGMPSKDPDGWRKDVEFTREHLGSNKLLNVSVVGTVQPDWTIDDLANDYAQCAKWAMESGADTVESNFSCPNVDTCDGQLFQNPSDASIVAAAVKDAVGATPCIAKIGHVLERERAIQLLDALGDNVDGIAMTNSIATLVEQNGEHLFEGARRGICGKATLDASVQQTALFRELINEKSLNIDLIGVGGASSADDVQRYLTAGASAVHMATSAMQNPAVALEIRNQWNQTDQG